ncbi:MAG: ABC transporter permease [Gemmatimonadetes bacterium]|nr:MAG: ABC transporter permease [Gemmatimonadota bacterium]
MSKKLIDLRQSGILADRYFDVMMGDFKSLLLMVAQAVFLAGLVSLVWENIGRATDTLYFVLVLIAIWLGCTNACREIVKEQAIFFRERMVNLNIGAYVFSKIRVLAMIGFVQCLLLLMIVHYYVHLSGNKLLIFLTLYLSALVASLLGLVLSAITDSEAAAVFLVPLVVIPQILLSEIILPPALQSGITAWLEKLMILKWGYHSLTEITDTSVRYLLILRDFAILAGFGLSLFALATILLTFKPNRL